MKKLTALFILLTVLFFGCDTAGLTEITEVTEETTEVTNIINKDNFTYCDIELYNGDCWSDNDNVWYTIDLSSITGGGNSVIEIEIIHTGGDTTETISCEFRKNSDYSPVSTSARNNDYNGLVIFSTDENSCFEWQHTWGAEVARLINLTIKLRMY
jgi:hypothetical protein